MRGLFGSFAVLPLAELVDLLARRRMTGSLTCERGTVRKTLHLREGSAVGAASNDPREYLGQLLVNFGHLDEDQLTKAFRTQEETNIRLGKVLTMVGLVSADTVREVLAIKIRETLLDVFLWEAGLFTFDDDPPAGIDELDATVPLVDIAREAEFRATAWSAFRGEFPTGAAALEIDDAKAPRDVGPDTVDGRLLALARDGKTIDEIGIALRATDFHLYQRLYALARQGVVRAVAPPAPAPARAPAPAPATPPASADTFAAADLLEAERNLAARLRGELLEPPRRPRRRVPSQQIAALAISAADKYLLSRCDGARDVRQLAQLAPMRELDVLKAIRRFVDAELVELG